MNSVTALQWMGAAAVACGVAGVWVALYYIRAAIRTQREALAIVLDLTRRLNGTGEPPDDPPILPWQRDAPE